MSIERSLRLDLWFYLSVIALLCLGSLALGVYALVEGQWEPLLLPGVVFGTLLGCWFYFRRR